MARLVSSDGVQVNLFLDLDSNNTGEGTLLYGPKSQPNMDFIVQGFKNFRTNTEFNNRNKLVFHCHHEITVNISSITGANYPTSSNPHVVDSETQLYYVGDDLVLSTTGMKIYRIDLFKSASTNDVFTVNGASPDASGNVTVTVGNDHSTEITNLTTRVSTLELSGGGGGTGTFSPPEVLWERTGTSTIWYVGHTTNGYGSTTSPHMTDFLGKYGDYYKLEVHILHGGVEEFFIEDIHTNSLLRRRRELTNGKLGNAAAVGQLNTVVGIDDQGDVTIYISNQSSITDVSIQRILAYKNPLGGPTDISQLNDSTGLLSSGGGGGRVLVFNSSDTYNKPAGVVGLEILMVAGGQGGGSTFNSMATQYYDRPTSGGNTTITGLPGGDKIVYGGGTIETLKGALSSWGVGYYGYIATPNTGAFTGQTHGTQSTPHNSSLMGGGQGGYGGEDGGPCAYIGSVPNTSTSYAEYWNSSLGGNGGGGYRAAGSEITPSNKSLSGGQGSTNKGLYNNNRTYSGDASDWYFSAPLGGAMQGDNTTYYTNGGSGKFSGGGGGSHYTKGGMGAGGGGGGIGAGGGACAWSSYGQSWVSEFFSGGIAGESLQFTISVPSAAASYGIVVGAGGEGSYHTRYGGFSARLDLNSSSGGGGQGIVIIKEISDLTISTP